MRFVIEATPVDGGWDVAVHGVAQPAGPRRMQRIGEFPQRPEAQPGQDPEKTDLWNQTDPDQIRSAFARIASGTPARREVALFGQYLFQALLGDALWQAIGDAATPAGAAGDGLIELALSFQPGDTDLHRLPWETLHSGASFLTAEPLRLVAVTRLVPAVAAQAATRTVEARVLFVVGAALSDPELRPGAEYLGLIRRLEASGLGLSSHLLLQATVESLRDAVLEIRPSIVHVIAHGAFSGGRAVLKLTDKDTRKPTREVTGEQLANLLREPAPDDPAWQGPAIVVLNACYSGQAFGGLGGALPKDRNIRPLAAELVYRGIPLVVGMGGRVADRACRIFTRRFYETLLQGDPIRGIAQGRRAGHGEGTSPEDTIDWALPVLFLDPAVTVSVDRDARFPTLVRQAFKSLARYLKHKPTAFCDRISCMADAQELVVHESEKKPVRRVMAVHESLASSRDSKLKYGHTWVLEHIALQAIQNGHIPCFVRLDQGDEPETLAELGDYIRNAIIKTRKHFGLDNPVPFELLRLRRRKAGEALPLHEELELYIDQYGLDSPDTLRHALHLDLLRLRDEIRKQLGWDRAQVLVLIDNLHQFGGLEAFLEDSFLTAEGLGTRSNPIPVVFSFYKTETLTTGKERSLIDVAERMYVIDHLLTVFESPAKDRMAYEQYLLQREPPLIANLSPGSEPDVQGAFEAMHGIVKGVPSLLKSQELEALIQFARIRALRAADDEDWLKRQGLLP